MQTNRQIWKVAYPILLSLLAQNIISITDTAFLGRVGEVELGASALAGVCYMAIYMLGFGFSTGSQIVIARRNGESRYADVGPVFLQGIAFLLFLALLIVVLSYSFSAVVMDGLIRSPQVLKATLDYLDFRIYGLFFAFVNVMFRAFFVGITQTRVLTANALVMAITNIVLDYVLIFGAFGMPAMGISGAALASVIAEAVSMLYFVGYMLRTVDLRKYGMASRFKFEPSVLKRVLSVSIWTMIQSFLALGTWFLFFVAMEHLSERSLAVSNIVRSISTLMFMPVSAFSTTVNTLVSNLMGEGRQGEVISVVWRTVGPCMISLMPIMLFLVIFPELSLRIYTEDLSLIRASVPSLLVLISAYVLVPVSSIFFNAVSGTGNTRSALFLESVALLVYMLYVWFTAYYLTASVAVCWTSEHVYWIAVMLLSALYFKKATWQLKKI